MPKTQEYTVYTFDELTTDRAKEAARNWYREGALDYNWWDGVYEAAETVGKMIGIDLNKKPVRLMNGGTRYDPAIYFSGFSSQGDGACFECDYSYAKGSVSAVKSEFPTDTQLHTIAADLQDIQRRNFYRLRATSKHTGHYYHSHCMNISVWRDDDSDITESTEEAVKDSLRDFADWIYHTLESEYNYLMSDESVDDSILANGYTFDEYGNREN